MFRYKLQSLLKHITPFQIAFGVLLLVVLASVIVPRFLIERVLPQSSLYGFAANIIGDVLFKSRKTNFGITSP